MTVHEATQKLTSDLKQIYEAGEAIAISDWVIRHLAGLKSSDRPFYRDKILSAKQEELLIASTTRLLQHEPVQYVLNESWFCGLKFYVDQNVLIPRPETEELVEWVITHCKFPLNNLSILDIGSGSGCIPISLKRKLRKAEVWSLDASEEALEVAKKNASILGVDVNFLLMDFLDKERRKDLSRFDIIISNPPYIPEKDKTQMSENVINYEPHEALFVPDDDPLIFYKAISGFGKDHLNPGGMVYVELHEDFAEDASSFFLSAGYTVELKNDMQGKSRMLRAIMQL
jgi:release factor glutamine methyltransferase